MQKKRARTKFTSFLLIVVMLLNIMPIGTITAVSSQSDTQSVQPAQPVATVPNPDYVARGSVRELKSRREEKVKHFLLPDNTVQAVVYSDAVHRKDASGNWQDISNDLILTEEKDIKFYTTEDARVVFAEKYAPNTQLWQLNENGYSIAMGMSQLQLSADAAVKGGVTVTNAPQRREATTWHSVEEARVVDNTASIVYTNVKANTDLEYIMVGNDIKENIVVKTRSNSYTYQFQMTLTGLTAALNDNGGIILADSATGEQRYTIPAPYMYDAAGKHSNSVSYTLKQTGKGAYALTVTADSRWIDAADRTFPVRIDPSVTSTSAKDTFIYSGYPDYPFGYSTEVWVGNGAIGYFYAPMPTLPSDATIMHAYMNLSYYYYENVTSGYVRASCYQVLQPWDENTFTWDLANQHTNYGFSMGPVSTQLMHGNQGAYPSSPKWVAYNITSAAQAWYSGTANYGLAVKYINGTNSTVIFNSKECAAAYRPYFTVTYSEGRIADGVYTLQNVGTNLYADVRAGGYTAGTAVQQYTIADSAYMCNQLFKITYLRTNTADGQNYYSIRPMTNSGMGLSAPLTGDSRNVTIETMPYDEDYNLIPEERQWVISTNGSYFTIKNGSGTQGGYLVSEYSAGVQMGTVNTVNSYSLWRMEQYTGPTIQGAFLTALSPEVIVGTSYNLDAVMYSSQIGVNGPVEFSVCGTDDLPTNKAYIDPTTGSGSTAAPGTVMVVLTFEGSSENYKYELGIKTATCKTVVVDMKYDHAYLLRYTDAEDRIRRHFYTLRELYISEFNIWVVMTGPTVFSCYACNYCLSLSSPLGSCTCEGTCQNSTLINGVLNLCNLHHTNLSNILYHIDVPDDETDVIMGFIGHECCDNSAGHDEAPYGLAVEIRQGMVISVSESGPDSEEIESLTVVHEFGHMFGVDDHYGAGGKSTDVMNKLPGGGSYNRYCIYGEERFAETISDNLIMCDGCRMRIEENWDKYSIE